MRGKWRARYSFYHRFTPKSRRGGFPAKRVFVGTPSRVADEWARYVRTRAVDGINVSPHLIPSSLDDIVDKLVPQLQDRGAYRTAYEGTTLREHLALPTPVPREPARGGS